jgi:hypothetical protein
MNGGTQGVPEWVICQDFAREHPGIQPWQVKDVPALWFDRWQVRRDLEHRIAQGGDPVPQLPEGDDDG